MEKGARAAVMYWDLRTCLVSQARLAQSSQSILFGAMRSQRQISTRKAFLKAYRYGVEQIGGF